MEDNNLKDFVRRAKLYGRLGKVYYLKKDYENSVKFYDKSLLEDQNSNVKDELRKVLKEKKDYETQAYINPEIAEQHNTKGGELFKLGK
jgi:stress-induced-phosphoprotein 1